jgi:hypothetical protein
MGLPYQNWEYFNQRYGHIHKDSDLTVEYTFHPLPEKSIVLKYVAEHMNLPIAMSRIVHRPSFMKKLHSHLDGELGQIEPSSSWMCLVHIVIALGALYTGNEKVAQDMYSNAYQYLRGDFWNSCDLTAVQAVLLMVSMCLNIGF